MQIDQTVLTLAGFAIPLIAGFTGWLIKLGAKVSQLERDFGSLKIQMDRAEVRADKFGDSLHRIEQTTAVTAEQVRSIFNRLEDKRTHE